MTTTTVRISERSHEVLRKLSELRGITMTQALDEITAAWQRHLFFEELNASFAALKSDPDAWAEELEERSEWDRALIDDLEDDAYPEAEPRGDLVD